MRASWVVEPMSAKDVDDVLVIEEVSFSHPWPREAFVADAAYAPWARALVLRDAARPGGGVRGYIFFWALHGEMEIQNIAVAPEDRRLGGAWALMTAAVKEARLQGCEVAWLEVRPSNRPGRELYRRWGFAPAGRRRHYYQDGEDALVLKADLTRLSIDLPDPKGSGEHFLKARKGG